MAKDEKLNEEAAMNNNLTAATYRKNKTVDKQGGYDQKGLKK
ncbi:hypothetical protein [Litchfieldia salsa]|uniref:Uncharacterized protein n=1 Tax=Litchfieldia salsa TaxID=930152 RepID=A0A1H0WQP6_9BACI|nr:hypothetical protein [Litchfieldia salsa]SDP92987.1 hypothetical protein SAMN05216565_113103 [Litchfieldia salsa]